MENITEQKAFQPIALLLESPFLQSCFGLSLIPLDNPLGDLGQASEHVPWVSKVGTHTCELGSRTKLWYDK